MSHAKCEASPEATTVLIAEDSPTQAARLRWLLEENGFKVIAARDGAQAIAMAKEAHPSIIVSDVVMPKVNGYELCRAIKADPALDQIGIILLTTLASTNDVFSGLAAGADDFVVKPYQDEQLIERIFHLLENRPAHAAAERASPLEVELGGRNFTITSGRRQVTNFLVSTYEQALALNEQLHSQTKELQRSNDMVNAIYELAGGFNRCNTEAEVASTTVTGALRIPGVQAAWLFLRDGDSYWLAGQAGRASITELGADVEKCACLEMLDSGLLNAAVTIEHCCRAKAASPEERRGHVSIPLTVDGDGAGVLNLSSNTMEGTFTPAQRRILASIGNQISDALKRTRLQKDLERQVEDRTRQLNAEVVVRRNAEREAATANQRLLDAIDCMNDGFALYDAGDRLVVHNRRYADMHAEQSALITRNPAFETLLRAGLGGKESPSEADIQNRLALHQEAAGKSFIQQRGNNWFMTRERRTGEGGIVVIETDITELKKVEIAKDNFLAMVSHELRTPLTPINGALSLISSGKVVELTKNLSELTDLARRNCDRMMSIVNELLDFTRITSGRFSLNKQRVKLTPFLEEIIDNKRIGPATTHVTLKVSPGARSAWVDVDPTRIQQVLDNLLSNAIKFTAPNDDIEVNIGRQNSSLRVSVADHGPGIPKRFQSQAFSAFTQADTSTTRQRGGIGLGLSISKSIVEAHGGKIGFTSKEGEGSTFYFDLPIVPREQTDGAAHRSASRH